MIYLDAGTTYSKIITTEGELFEEKYFIKSVNDFPSLEDFIMWGDKHRTSMILVQFH